MKDFRKDFEAIFHSVTGDAPEEYRIPWAENAFAGDTSCSRAYEEFDTARENLCRRFGMDWEDEDLERFMNGILMLEQDLAKKMFLCGITYAHCSGK